MHKINNNLIVDLTPFLDVISLKELKPYIEYGLSKHSDRQVPSQYLGDIFLDKGLGFIDIDQNQKEQLIKKYPYLNELNGNQLLYWLRYHLDVTYGQSHLHIISAKDWLTKHLPEHCDTNPVTETFKPLLDWIESQNIFSSYGRVNAFLNEPGTSTPIHHDPPYLHESPKDQFIWINLSDRKKFFVYDHVNKQKHYITSEVSTFDNHNYHGSDSNNFANWSIRVDGTFSKEFLTRTNLANHFG